MLVPWRVDSYLIPHCSCLPCIAILWRFSGKSEGIVSSEMLHVGQRSVHGYTDTCPRVPKRKILKLNILEDVLFSQRDVGIVQARK